MLKSIVENLEEKFSTEFLFCISLNEMNRKKCYIYQVQKGFKMNRIKEVLEKKGLTQVWLAETLGKSYNMVNSYAQNRRQPSIEVLFEIAKILEVDPKELISSKNVNLKK